MRWQTTALLAVILIALGGFYYVYEIRMSPEREQKAARQGRVFSAEPTDVASVELKREGGTLRLTRDGDAWQMVEPVKARGDRGTIDGLLTTVLTAKMDREIASSPASLGEYGLQSPVAEIGLTLKDGKQLGLLLGAKNPTGVWVYAQEKGKPSVVVLGEAVLRDATRPVPDFRDKSILAFDRSAVSGLELVLRDDAIALQPKDGKWAMTRPVALGADDDVVREFLDKLQNARVKEFVTEAPKSLQPYGLDHPARVVLHTGKEGERSTKTLLVGRVDTGKGVYAMRPGETSVLLLPEEVWAALPKNVGVLRDKTVVAFERDKLASLQIESPRGAVSLVRENDRWRVTAPEALPADGVEVGTVLARLQNLKALAFLSEDASGIPRWLARPEVRVTLTEQGQPPKTVLLAPSPERRGGQPTAYAAVAGKGPVVLVEGAALTAIGRPPVELRDRTLVSGLEPRDVMRVRVKSGGTTVVLERRGESEWRMVEPSKGEAKAARVDDLLFTLRSLKWREIANAEGKEPARYGLDAPVAEVTLAGKDGKDIATVLIGKQEGDRTYVRTQAAPTIYAVDAKRLGDLPKTADDFKA